MEKSMSDATRMWLYNRFSSDEATKSKLIPAVWCNVTCEAAGQIRTWSLLGVRGLKQWTLFTASSSVCLSFPY